MNGPSKPVGRAGAVWTNGNPAENYCKGSPNDAGLKYPWWAACCEWTGTECIPKPTAGDDATPEEETTEDATEQDCPARCSTCKAGGAGSGGLQLNNGVCRGWCSRYGYCGGSKAYKS